MTASGSTFEGQTLYGTRKSLLVRMGDGGRFYLRPPLKREHYPHSVKGSAYSMHTFFWQLQGLTFKTRTQTERKHLVRRIHGVTYVFLVVSYSLVSIDRSRDGLNTINVLAEEIHEPVGHREALCYTRQAYLLLLLCWIWVRK